MGTEATALSALQAGALASLVTMVSTDANLLMVVIIGFIGGCIFFFKEWTHLTIKTTKLKALSELFFTIPTAISTAGIVFYAGTNGVNQYFDMGDWIWIFLALLASLHFKTVIKFSGEMIKAFTLEAISMVKFLFGGKK